MGLFQQPGQPPEVPVAIRAPQWFQLGRVAPPGDKVRIGVLLAAASPVEVVDQARRGSPAEHLPDHRMCRRTFSAAASRRSALRKLSAAYGRRSAERCPVAFSFATA